VSRSARYAIGSVLLLILLGAGSGYAVARWGQKESTTTDWRPDWGAVQRGWACVTGEFQDVADLLTPDRSPVEPDVAILPADPIGSPGDTRAAAETGEREEIGSPLQSFFDQTQDFFASLGDEVPRLDESASAAGSGC
jgi:hypothetical protein